MVQTKKFEHEDLDEPIVYWKMNYGFRQDFNDYAMEYQMDENDSVASMQIKTGHASLYWLVFGIFRAPSLNIQKPNDIRRGLSDREIKDRLAVVRTMDIEIAEALKNEIMSFNNSTEEGEEEIEETAKK